VSSTAEEVEVAEQSGSRRVLDAAAELFVSQGYAATTLRQIAAKAGIKAGSIYHHFDSKEVLFVAVLDDGIGVMIEAFDAATDRADGGAIDDRLGAHVRGHLGALFEFGSYTAAHVTAFFTAPPAVRKRVIKRRDAYEQKWAELFHDLFPGRDDNDLRLRRLLLFGAMNTTTEWYDPQGATSLDQLAITITDQFLTGVSP
jgi:AcrR family transcriptional regulator